MALADAGDGDMKHKTQIEHHPLGPDLAAHLATQMALREARLPHHPMPLTVAIQFYSGDQRDALKLARFLADVEPEYRDDFALVLASRFDVDQGKDIRETLAYCSRKFPVSHIRSQRRVSGYPDGAFGIWSGICEQLWIRYATGMSPNHSVFFVEADGVPLCWNWIDEIKKAHQRTLDAGKRVTGARTTRSGFTCIDGSMVMHLSLFADRPSLRACPSGVAWDIFHGQVLTSEAGIDNPISQLYGARRMSRSTFVNLGREFAWLPSAKDDSAMKLAREFLIPQTKKARRK